MTPTFSFLISCFLFLCYLLPQHPSQIMPKLLSHVFFGNKEEGFTVEIEMKEMRTFKIAGELFPIPVYIAAFIF